MGISISQMFTTTTKGLPNTQSLPASITMSRSYYINSLLLQIVFLLIFILYFVVSIYRVVKKIKNSRFQDIPEEDKQEEDEANKTELDAMNEHEVSKDKEGEQPQNLIYRFDEEEEEGEDKKNDNKEEDDRASDKENDLGSAKDDKE
jgi:flagellar biosynthesis/type III secretory pathway M-ring protein FliF/YscJ